MAPLPSWRGGLLLLFCSSFCWHVLVSKNPCPARACGVTPSWVFSTEKRRGGGIPVSGPAARTTRPEPPCSMPPVCGSRLDRQPDSRLQPTRPQLYGPTAQDPPVPPPIPGTPAGFWPGRRASTPAAPCHSPARRRRIGFDASSPPLMALLSPEHPRMHPQPGRGTPCCV